MTSSSNTQDLVFKARFEDDASEDIQNLDGDVQELDSSMGGLTMSSVGAGLAMFGVGVGVQQVIQGAIESHKSLVATKALIQLLPEAAQQGLAELAPFYDTIGVKVAATRNEVEQTAVGIARSAGSGIVPALEDIAFAYDLAAAFGIPMAEAADKVGQALGGNEEPLNKLLDNSGKDYHGLNEAMEKLKGTAEAAKVPLDDLNRIFKESMDRKVEENAWYNTVIDSLAPMASLAAEVGIALSDLLAAGDDELDLSGSEQSIKDVEEALKSANQVAFESPGIWDMLWLAISGKPPGGGDKPEEKIKDVRGDLNDMLHDMKMGEDEDLLAVFGNLSTGQGTWTSPHPAEAPWGDASNMPFGGQGVESLTINIQGDVDSEQRAESLLRKVEEGLRNIFRGGGDSFFGNLPGFMKR